MTTSWPSEVVQKAVAANILSAATPIPPEERLSFILGVVIGTLGALGFDASQIREQVARALSLSLAAIEQKRAGAS